MSTSVIVIGTGTAETLTTAPEVEDPMIATMIRATVPEPTAGMTVATTAMIDRVTTDAGIVTMSGGTTTDVTTCACHPL